MTVAYTENSAIDRPDWVLDGSNKEYTLSYTPDLWSVFAFLNGLFVKVSYILGKKAVIETAPYSTDKLQIRYCVSAENPYFPNEYASESSEDTLTGVIDGVNAAFTLSASPDPWAVHAFINGLYVPCEVSGLVVTLSVVPQYGDVVTVRYTINGVFPAYWKSGYFGIEEPRRFKFFRHGQLVCHGAGFEVKHYFVDHFNYFFEAPLETGYTEINGAKFTVSVKSALHQVYVKFPDDNIAADVLQLSDSFIPRSER